MKHHRIFHALTNIKEEYITEAAPPAKPKRQWWKAGVGLAACLCLVVVAAMTIPFGGGGGTGDTCEEPEIYKPYDLTILGDTAYFTAYDKVYCRQPGDKAPTELAQFRGTFHKTQHGLFSVDEQTGQVYQINGEDLTLLGTIPPYDAQFLDSADSALYWAEGTRIYTTDLPEGEPRLLFSFSGIQYQCRDIHMADGRIWFTEKGGFFRYYDLATGEIVTYCDSFWSQLAEPWDVTYYDDFILCRCTQYQKNEQGTHDNVGGYHYYRLDYGSSDPVFLSHYTSLSGTPSLLDGSLFYVDQVDGVFSLVSLDAQTGKLTVLGEGGRYLDELTVTPNGIYYVKDYDLYYYDYSTGESLLLVDKED